MKQGRQLQELYQQRIHAFRELKELLEQQQESLVTHNTQLLQETSDKLVTGMENIARLEKSWRRLLTRQYQGNGLSEVPEDTLSGFQLSQDERMILREHQAQLRQLLKEIEQIKEANRTLLDNSLGFVSTLLRNILEGDQQAGLYGPGKKVASSNRLINRTL